MKGLSNKSVLIFIFIFTISVLLSPVFVTRTILIESAAFSTGAKAGVLVASAFFGEDTSGFNNEDADVVYSDKPVLYTIPTRFSIQARLNKATNLKVAYEYAILALTEGFELNKNLESINILPEQKDKDNKYFLPDIRPPPYLS